MKKLQVLAFTFALMATGGLAGCQSDPPLEVAPDVSLSQLQGKWYEIARLPRSTQVDCHGTTAFYSSAADGSLSFINQCNVGGPNGPLQTVAMTATVPDQSVPAKLALNVGGYTGDYWILEVGSNYEYAVVGHPSRLYLWILSRTPTLDSSVMSGLLERAQLQQFDTTKLEYTPQPPVGERNNLDTPEGEVSAPPRAGCSFSALTPASGNGRSGWPGLLGFAIAATALRRRRRLERR